jgi:hypothetical protein
MTESPATRAPAPLLLSDTGLLVHGQRRVRLSGTDGALVRRLLDQHPLPLPTRDLPRVLWPEQRPSDVALRRRLARIRRELLAVGLALRHRHGLGYTLERSPIGAGAPSRLDEAGTVAPRDHLA